MLTEPKRNLVTPLHFARFEFKYVLPKRRRDDVEAHLRYFLELDPFVRDREDHKYSVRSLYYDTAIYTAFHDKIDGLHSRRKFRVRTYNEEAGGPAPYFLEIKGRHNNLVFKHRTPIPAGDWINASGDNLSGELIKHADHGGVRDQFAYEYYKRHIRPVALIDYKRRPYISKYDSSFRITFDEQLTCFQAGKMFPEDVAQLKHIVPGHTVMEVKFHHHLPFMVSPGHSGPRIEARLNIQNLFRDGGFGYGVRRRPITESVMEQVLAPVATELLTYTLTEMSVNTILAICIGFWLAFIYQYTHKGLSYSQSFTQTLIFVTLIVAVVMMVIGGSLARAFALVGAMSIIRFRTVLKDTKDLSYVFAALALGMAAGTSNYFLACLGTFFISALVFVLNMTNFGSVYKSEFILRFRFNQNGDSAAFLTAIKEFCKRSNLLHIEPSGDGNSLMQTYDIALRDEVSHASLISRLDSIEDVSEVVLIASKNDVDY